MTSEGYSVEWLVATEGLVVVDGSVVAEVSGRTNLEPTSTTK